MARVRLHSLQLTGFKSFCDPVELEFPAEITAIIGPNGCGKSNVVDAILWVLGEQSPKSLRLKQMGDLVFAGATTRQPAGAAEVTLTLRSDDGRWSDHEGRMVVSRRVFRSGPSEYRLNGRAARLKDVFDELAAVGLGTRAYSIIEQDRVGQVLSARPADRRVLLEEAAGITRYKARKHDAELKLEQTRQNLLRLDDVVAEVDRSLRALRRQAREAERYRALEIELKQRLLEHHRAQAHRLDQRRRELRRRRAEAQNEVAAAASALAGTDADLTALRRTLDGTREELEQARAEVATLMTSRERLEAFLERSADLLDSLRGSLERGGNEATALATTRRAVAERAAEASARLEALEAALADATARRETGATEEQATAARLKEAEQATEQRRQELLRAISALTTTRNRLRDLEREGDRLAYTARQLAQESERLGARRSQAAERFAAARAAAAAAAARSKELEGERHRLAGERSALAEEAAAAGHEAETLTHTVWELRHELAGVERELAQHSAALDQVAEILPEEALLGQVSARLAPDPELAPLLDRVWREWLELPVVKADALEATALAHLSEAETRIRLALAGPATDPAPAQPMSGAEALLPLAGATTIDAAWLTRVLPPAYRCGDGDTARRLAEAHPYALFLAPDGTVWRGHTADLPTAGSRLRGALELGSQRARLTAEREATARRAEERRSRRDELGQRVTVVEDALSTAQQALVEAEQERARTAAQEQSLGDDVARLERELEAVETEIGRTRSQQEAAARRHDELGAELAGLEERSEQLEQAVGEASSTVDERREEAGEALRRLDRWRAEVRLAEERAASGRSEVHRLEEEGHGLQARITELESQVAKRTEELATTEQEVIASRTRLVEEQGLLAAAREQERRLAERAEREAARTGRLEKEVATRRDTHEGVRSKLHEVEVEEARTDSDWERLREAAGAELGTTIDELLAEPRPESEEEALHRAVEELRARLERLGPVNLLAIREVAELEERSGFLHEQRKDLVESLSSLQSTIRDIDATCSERFLATFQQVNLVFAETFSHLFGGGSARLDLADEDDPLESGIDIVAQPPGKKNQSVQLLSGGEKALTALSLLIALFRIRPAPFCILDEVDAPLDDANVERLAELVREMTEHTQFVLITHNRRTMTRADVLYGVTMEEAGVSKLVSVRMD